MKLCTSLLAAVLVIAASAAYGQQQVIQGGVLPPRDAGAAARTATGTASIRGRVFYFEGRRRLVPEGPPSMTDDAGQYRILALTPGSYYVMADIRETWTVVENGVERTMGYAQTYYPGTPGFTDARRVTVGVGEE